MFQFNLHRGAQLHRMMTTSPNIRKSIFGLMRRVISMVHSEGFNPQTVDFLTLSPAGELDKFVIVLEKADYMDGPLVLDEVQPNDASAQFTGFVNSLYKAIVGDNGAVAGFLHACPGLATLIYAVANHIYAQWYSVRGKDISREMSWDSYDWWRTNDLLITGVFHG